MDEIRACIVGAGSFSTRRIYPYIGAAGGVIAGICTRTRVRAEENARRFGGRAYDDIDEMLDTEKPDCVIVCIGPKAHPDMAVKIMEKGYPVYLEKPPSLTSAEAIRMARVSKQTGQLCSIAYKKRYATVFDRAKAWIGQFPEEELCSISIDCASGAFQNDGPETSFLLQCGIHIIDLILYLYGDVEKVFCFARGMNAYSINLRFASGAIGTMNLSDVCSFTIPTEEVEIAVHGGNFMRIHNGTEYKICEDGQCVEWREPSTFMSSGDTGHDTGLFSEIADFFAAVNEGRTTRSNIFESCKSMLLYEAILASAEQETTVTITYDGIPTDGS